MPFYRKKPVTVLAYQMPTSDGDFSSAEPWLIDAMRDGIVKYIAPEVFRVKTLEGDMIGRTGDYVVRGIQGEMYPVQYGIFIATYEAQR